ncbi:carbon-nitrogen hydrolase family protein [Methanobacterium sp. MZD130B]|jgi:predicted amidohydrolase|uniref:carbon-nitrogen hydrolase family protein n=1 Tax=Methanobacterium sp. MZD130B TaxID=3394378 RepID=UPI0039FCBB11
MKDIFNLAMCQMQVVDDKKKNIANALKMIKEASSNSDLVILPEMWNCPYQTELFPIYAEEKENSPSLKAISQAAKSEKTYIVAGSIPEKHNGKTYNSSFFFNPEGEIIGVHRKIHLFDIDVPDEVSFKESQTLTAGNKITVVDTELGKIGICICYDMRFPELLRLMALRGAKLIIIPGAFNMTTGPVHWKPLIKIRAVDNQLYVAAVSPARNDKSHYVAYGHSMVADPWGKVTNEAGSGEEIIYATIDYSFIRKVRVELPLLKNRREEIYHLDKKIGK